MIFLIFLCLSQESHVQNQFSVIAPTKLCYFIYNNGIEVLPVPVFTSLINANRLKKHLLNKNLNEAVKCLHDAILEEPCEKLTDFTTDLKKLLPLIKDFDQFNFFNLENIITIDYIIQFNKKFEALNLRSISLSPFKDFINKYTCYLRANSDLREDCRKTIREIILTVRVYKNLIIEIKTIWFGLVQFIDRINQTFF